MRRGTTPTLTFSLPFKTNSISKAKLMLKQSGVTLSKHTEDATMKDNTISWKLTSKETMLFKDNSFASVQIQVITSKGESLVSDIHQEFISEYLDSEVMV